MKCKHDKGIIEDEYGNYCSFCFCEVSDMIKAREDLIKKQNRLKFEELMIEVEETYAKFS